MSVLTCVEAALPQETAVKSVVFSFMLKVLQELSLIILTL